MRYHYISEKYNLCRTFAVPFILPLISSPARLAVPHVLRRSTRGCCEFCGPDTNKLGNIALGKYYGTTAATVAAAAESDPGPAFPPAT